MLATPTVLSRSGRTSADGKLAQRLDIPVSEDLHDLTVVAAAQRGIPKAEFVRDVLQQALVDGCWLPLSPEASRALDVLCALRETGRGDCLVGVLEQALKEQLGMLRIMAQGACQSPSDDFRKGRRE